MNEYFLTDGKINLVKAGPIWNEYVESAFKT